MDDSGFLEALTQCVDLAIVSEPAKSSTRRSQTTRESLHPVLRTIIELVIYHTQQLVSDMGESECSSPLLDWSAEYFSKVSYHTRLVVRKNAIQVLNEILVALPGK